MSNTANRLIESGLKIWEKNGKRRIYINDLDDLSLAFPDLKVSRYKTGNISSAKYKDEKISNSKAKKLIDFPKMYFDCLSDNWVNATDTAKEVFGI